MAVDLGFNLDESEICKTTKRGHVFAGFKIVDKYGKFPGTDKLMLQYDA